MRYYMLMYDYENDKKWAYCDIGNIGDISEYIMADGKPIEEWNEPLFEYDSSEGKILTDYLANVYRWLIVSSDFRRLTAEFMANDVQYLPIRVTDRKSGRSAEDYCAANVITTVDAFDPENSEYDVFEAKGKKVMFVRKYALHKSKIGGKHIFRLEKDTIPIFVSEAIKDIIKKNRLTGFDFLEVYTS